MLLIPIGRDQNEVRRTPWISIGLIAANVLIFILTSFAAFSSTERELEEKWQETIAYLREHPYLAVPPELKQYFPPQVSKQLDEIRSSYIANSSPRADLRRKAEQNQLGKLTAELLEIRSRAPQVKYGYKPNDPSTLTLLTSMFLHADFMHLLGNMLFFFVSGPFLEDVFGKAIFVVTYLVSGIFATKAHAWQFPASSAPLIGASGAIAGVMGAYMIRFIKAKTEFLFIPILLMPRLRFRFFLPAYIILPFWFAMQLYWAMNANEGSGVAFMAHVGGFVLGALIAIGLKLTQVEEKYIHPAIESAISWTQHPLLTSATEARMNGDLMTAKRQVDELLSQQPDNLDARREAFDVALAWEQDDEIIATGTKFLDVCAQKNEPELAFEVIQQVTERKHAIFPEKFYTRAAGYLERQNQHNWAAVLYRQVADQSEGMTGLRALMKLADMQLVLGEGREARATLERAKAHPACVAEAAMAVERKFAKLG